MAHHGLLGDYRFSESADDIRGAALYGRDDEKLGKIKDVIFDHATGEISYVVVDTGGWLSTKEFLVPVTWLQASSEHKDDFMSDLTKQQIESFPPYNKKDLDSPEQWEDYQDRYRAKWDVSPVMHRDGTDRNITPTTQQLEGNQSSLRASGETGSIPGGTVFEEEDEIELIDDSEEDEQGEDEIEQEEDVIAASTPTERIVPAGVDSVVISSNASGIGPRWDTFQDRLRQRRREAVTGCGTCSSDSTSTRDEWKKAS